MAKKKKESSPIDKVYDVLSEEVIKVVKTNNAPLKSVKFPKVKGKVSAK